MQIEIEPSIRNRIEELNGWARSLYEEHGRPANARLRHDGTHMLDGSPAYRFRFPQKHGKKIIMKIIYYHRPGFLASEEEAPIGKEWNEAVRQSYDNTFENNVNDRDRARYKPQSSLSTLDNAVEYFRANEETEEEVLAELKLAKGKRILELGPGAGHLIEKVLKRKATVIAIDHSDKVIAAIAKRFEKQLKTQQLLTLKGDYGELPPSESIDHAVSIYSTETHPFPDDVFKAVSGTLKKGGRYTVVELTPFHRELARLLQKAGLEIERVKVTPRSDTLYAIPGQLIHSYTTMITARKP